VNDLLSSGDIPDLFAPEDREEIIGAMRGEAKARGLPDTNDNCWRLFIQRVSCCHASLPIAVVWVIMCMTPAAAVAEPNPSGAASSAAAHCFAGFVRPAP
jgi:hypothetical protein